MSYEAEHHACGLYAYPLAIFPFCIASFSLHEIKYGV